MTDKERPIIKFALNVEWDAKPHVEFFYAPDDWADMTEEERQKFLEREAETFQEEKVERSYQVYATADEAEADDHGWGAYYDEPEDRW